MVDEALKEVFKRIENRTPEEQAEIDQNIKDDSERKKMVQLRTDVWQFILTKDEDHATEYIIDAIKERNHIYTTRDDLKSEIWIYENGIYKPNGESFIKEFVRSVLIHAYTPQRANKVIAKIEADTMIETDDFFNTQYLNEICVENGILNLKTRELSEFTPDKIFFNKLPVKFDPEAKCPHINSFFEEILKEKDDKKILFELTGFCLHKDYFIEKAFMFLGNGRNGKGKTLGLLKTFLGVENTCSVRLSQMEPQSSALCELHNRLVNLAGDLNNSSLKDTGLFKELTGRDSIQVKRKYLRDLIFTNYAKMVFACNELPRVYDLSLGFWSRWILLEFPYEFLPQNEINQRSEKEREFCRLQDPIILNKLTTPEELSGLLNEALDGLDRLKQNKDFSYSKGTSMVKDFWIRKSDSFTAFCLDKLEYDVEGFVSKKELRQEFVRYCKLHKLKGCSDQNIKIVLENMFGVIESRKGFSYETQERVWEGIVFKKTKQPLNSNRQDRHSFPNTLGNENYSTFENSMPTLTIDESLLEVIKILTEEYGKLIPLEKIKSVVGSSENLEADLIKLKQAGHIHEPKEGFFELL
jgi:P4 family phage/plasmid primase-like protien